MGFSLFDDHNDSKQCLIYHHLAVGTASVAHFGSYPKLCLHAITFVSFFSISPGINWTELNLQLKEKKNKRRGPAFDSLQ